MVALDIGPLGEELVPPAGSRKAQLVEQDRDVHGEARIDVIAPGTTEIVGTVQDHEVIDTLPTQVMRGGNATGAGPDDRHLTVDVTHANPRRMNREK